MSSEKLSLNGTLIEDTFAEAFPVVGTRLLITAHTAELARIAATECSGYASSVIACDAEADVERDWEFHETPDGRPGTSVLIFGFNRDGLQKAVAGRVGQCVLTCATTACHNGVTIEPGMKKIRVGGQIRYFGDGFQISKKLDNKRLWRIPVMDGEFLCEDHFGVFKGVGGGNLLIAGETQIAALNATMKAVAAMRSSGDVGLPFPGGFVRSGSKVGSQYPAVKASTNDKWCPTLRSQTNSVLPENVAAVYEIVVDGTSFETVQNAMRAGLQTASAEDGIVLISAGNYGGKLGKHHFHLRDLL
ncbi:MAG: formylmethanofuran--tetrahydromethanopterin N-formyltransferase [Planctomycetaceae bacterium]